MLLANVTYMLPPPCVPLELNQARQPYKSRLDTGPAGSKVVPSRGIEPRAPPLSEAAGDLRQVWRRIRDSNPV
jgi:hypothetical protein